MRTWILVPVLALALPLAACGDDTGGSGGAGGDASSTSTEATATSSASGTPTSSSSGGTGGAVEVLAACPATVDAEVTNTGSTAFSPAAISVPAGGVVRFTPEGPHNMTSEPVGTFATATSAVACLQFNTAGSYDFICSVHPNMTGTVTVN